MWLNLATISKPCQETVVQFIETVTAQANLEVEAYRLDPLYHNFRNWPVTRFPQPFYACPGVILESSEPGCIVSDFFATDERMASDINAAKAEAKQTRKDESNFEKSEYGENSDKVGKTEANDLALIQATIKED